MIQGNMLRDALVSASYCLAAQKQAVDALNIFPVPDGDTGTNMSMTLSAAARVVAKSKDLTVGEVAEQNASALLRGARGNIYDSDMNLLATYKTTWRVFLSTRQIRAAMKKSEIAYDQKIAKALSSLLSLDEAALLKKIQNPSVLDVTVKKSVSAEQ